MKNSTIFLIFLLFIGSGLAGYFIGKSSKVISDPIRVDQLNKKLDIKVDSFEFAENKILQEVDSIKKKRSKYSQPEMHGIPVKIITLPCDSDHILDSLQNDIRNLDKIIEKQDTMLKQKDGLIGFIRNELHDRNDQLANLQNRYNEDIDRQKKTRVNIFLSGIGVGAGAILIAVLIL